MYNLSSTLQKNSGLSASELSVTDLIFKHLIQMYFRCLHVKEDVSDNLICKVNLELKTKIFLVP